MSEELRKQFETNCSAVLNKANKIHGEIRQLIINFLGGNHVKPERKKFPSLFIYFFHYLTFIYFFKKNK